MTKLRRIASLLFIAVIVAGCTSIPENPTSVEWQSHQNTLQQVESYQAIGKLGYISPEQRQSLNFIWKHSPDQSQLRLTTFLGQTALNLTINKNGAKVVTYDDQVFTHYSASRLVEQLTGLALPIEHFPKWFIGIPADADSYQLNITNTLASLSKQVDGQVWRLSFDRYRDITLPNNLIDQSDALTDTTLPLPSKLSFTQDDNKINIVVSKWTLNR